MKLPCSASTQLLVLFLIRSYFLPTSGLHRPLAVSQCPTSLLPPTSGYLCPGHGLDVPQPCPSFTQAHSGSAPTSASIHPAEGKVQQSSPSLIFLKRASLLTVCLPLRKQVLGVAGGAGIFFLHRGSSRPYDSAWHTVHTQQIFAGCMKFKEVCV